jgi:hypothetical protein
MTKNALLAILGTILLGLSTWTLLAAVEAKEESAATKVRLERNDLDHADIKAQLDRVQNTLINLGNKQMASVESKEMKP